jgi:hypothetical protein
MMPVSPPLGWIATTPCAPTQRTKPFASSLTGVEPNAKRDFERSYDAPTSAAPREQSPTSGVSEDVAACEPQPHASHERNIAERDTRMPPVFHVVRCEQGHRIASVGLAARPASPFQSAEMSGGRCFEPSHGSAASGTGVRVDLKDMPEQPSPAFTPRGLVVVVAREKRELIALGFGRAVCRPVGRRMRDAMTSRSSGPRPWPCPSPKSFTAFGAWDGKTAWLSHAAHR